MTSIFKSRKFIIVGWLVWICIALFVYLAIQTTHECESLLDAPEVPIYPNATFLSEQTLPREEDYILLPSILGNRSEVNSSTRYYEVHANYKDVIAYYEQVGLCDEIGTNPSNTRCRANLDEDSEYFVLIDHTEKIPIEFTIEIWWHSCPTRLFS